MKRNDWKLIGGILLVAVAFLIGFRSFEKREPGKIRVTVEGTVFGEYSLEESQDIPIGKGNVLVIRDGKADMIDATCPDRLCVEQKPISKVGESLVCLPHQVIVTVMGGENRNADALAK